MDGHPPYRHGVGAGIFSGLETIWPAGPRRLPVAWQEEEKGLETWKNHPKIPGSGSTFDI